MVHSSSTNTIVHETELCPGTSVTKYLKYTEVTGGVHRKMYMKEEERIPMCRSIIPIRLKFSDDIDTQE